MTSISLKPLDEQVIVITGATSGIGLATARMAAERGAKLVLAARSAEDLDEVAGELRADGAEVAVCAADVGKAEDVEMLAAMTVERQGGFDTWVNNAGGSAFGYTQDIPLEEQRQVFDTVYWGVVHGSLAALAHLRDRGGAIINVGSVASEVALPLQVPYSAAKHAVKGFTDGLRLELQNEGVPVAITLIKPGSVDTPFEEHAAKHIPEEPRVPPPYASPELVAQAILEAAVTPTRERFVGPGSSAMAFFYHALPGVSDRILAYLTDQAQRMEASEAPGGHRGLLEPGFGGETRSSRNRMALQPTWIGTHPMMTLGLGVAAMLAVAGMARMRTHGPY